MSNVLFQTIDQISREKGIDPQIVIHAIEDAIVVASRKHFKSNEELRGRINPETGERVVEAHDLERRQPAPEIERVGQFFKPHLLRQEHLARERRARTQPRVTPTDELVVPHDVLEARRVQDENVFDS